MASERSGLHQELVEALLDSRSIDLEAVGSMVSKFAERAARDGVSVAQIINRDFFWACGWPGPEIEVARPVIRQIVE